jgi:transcriptional regulator with XRE-family HTH domain
MSFGEIIKKIRATLNITQEQFARDLNISYTTLNRWENGRNVPSRLARMRIADYCKQKNVSPDIVSELERTEPNGGIANG